MRSALEAGALASVLVLPCLASHVTPARAAGTYCRTSPDTAAVAINMVKHIVTSSAPRDSAFRASSGIKAEADSEIVLVVDEAKCREAIDTLNAEATRYGGPGISGGVYLVSIGSQYAVYAPPGPRESTGLDFMDAQFHVFVTTVVP